MADDPTITLTRHILATPDVVWRCWTDPALLPQWFGPAGYTCHTKEIDLRQGGLWRFDMRGPDGKVWPNRHRYTLMDRPRRIAFLMDDDADDSPVPVVVTIEAVPGGTLLTQVMTFPTLAQRKQVEGFGAVELGNTTMAKLAHFAENLGPHPL